MEKVPSFQPGFDMGEAGSLVELLGGGDRMDGCFCCLVCGEEIIGGGRTVVKDLILRN
jgi:hypothetical protein